MKILKKLSYVLLLILLAVFPGCRKDGRFKIGIIQIVEHESLDNARRGFIDELVSLGYEDGKNVEYETEIAGGDLSNCQQIADKYVDNRKDLILAISTPCAQAAANATRDIPIVSTAVTNFEEAGLVKSHEKPNTNVTGVSDLAPIDKIIELIPKLNPEVKKIGILYSNIDTSPQYQTKLAVEKIREMGLEEKTVTVSQIHEVQQVSEKLAQEVDALYVPIDKITASSMPQISHAFLNNKKFVVCAEDIMASKGAAAAYGFNYYELGKMAAHQAFEILEGKNIPQNMQVKYLKDANLILNDEIINKLGITVPKEIKGDLQ